MIKYNSGFIAVSNAALAYNCSRQAIRKAIKVGRLDAYKVGHAYIIKTGDFSKFFEKGRSR